MSWDNILDDLKNNCITHTLLRDRLRYIVNSATQNKVEARGQKKSVSVSFSLQVGGGLP